MISNTLFQKDYAILNKVLNMIFFANEQNGLFLIAIMSKTELSLQLICEMDLEVVKWLKEIGIMQTEELLNSSQTDLTATQKVSSTFFNILLNFAMGGGGERGLAAFY